MADRRKLQGEIDRCLKKVQEGVETFEDIWQKVHNSANTNQKEKYEADLKKEIKKLQRLRDQIKSWIASGEIKDKSTLMDTRKLIETQMERFKVVERETKTKAYSKEGLGAAQKLDPAQKEKEDINNWLANTIDALNVQTDHFESEIESLQAGVKKKKVDKDKQDRIDELKNFLEKHRYHIRQLETLMRMLDNCTIDVDQVVLVSGIKKIKDDVEYYVESSQEPDFEENEFIYDDLDLEDIDSENANFDAKLLNSSENDENSTVHSGTPTSTTSGGGGLGGGGSGSPIPMANHSSSSSGVGAGTNAKMMAGGDTDGFDDVKRRHNSNDDGIVQPVKPTAVRSHNTSSNSSSSSSVGGPGSTTPNAKHLASSINTNLTPTMPTSKTNSGPSLNSLSNHVGNAAPVVPPTLTGAPYSAAVGGHLANSSQPILTQQPRPLAQVVAGIGSNASLSSTANSMNSSAAIQSVNKQQATTPRQSSIPSETSQASYVHNSSDNSSKLTNSIDHASANNAGVQANNGSVMLNATAQQLTPLPTKPVSSLTPQQQQLREAAVLSLLSSQNQQQQLHQQVVPPPPSISMSPAVTATSNGLSSANLLNNSLTSFSLTGSTNASAVQSVLAGANRGLLQQQQQQLQQQVGSLVNSGVLMNGPRPIENIVNEPTSMKQMAQQALSNAGLETQMESHLSQSSNGLYNDSSALLNSVSGVSKLLAPVGGGSVLGAGGAVVGVQSVSLSASQLAASVLASTSEAHIPPLLAVAPIGPYPLSKEHVIQLRMLEAASHHLPHASDSEKLRLYLPRNPFPTPSYYPQIPPPHSDNVEFFQRLSTEALFFIFYYMEGTKAQYLAAKALKKQSWRFHTNYKMWFQRHEEPKTITDEYEQGTYIYFDYEKWEQRRKNGFTFEYKYLEDRDLN